MDSDIYITAEAISYQNMSILSSKYRKSAWMSRTMLVVLDCCVSVSLAAGLGFPYWTNFFSTLLDGFSELEIFVFLFSLNELEEKITVSAN